MQAMGGNPKDSPWYGVTTKRTERARKGVELTLSDAARAALERRAKRAKLSRSAYVERWLLEDEQ